MNWLDSYKKKLTTPDKAIEKIKSGDRIIIGSGCAVPQELTKALNNVAADLKDVEIVSLLTMGEADYTGEKYHGIFRHNAFFTGGNTRKAVNEGRADFMPIFLSEIPNQFTNGNLPIDVAMIQVSPPDDHGFCSFGISVDIVKPAAMSAKCIIAEVNEKMPRTLGDSFIHVNKLHAVVESERSIHTLPEIKFTDVHLKIGRNVADLITDGATLQMGIGAIPNSVLNFLEDKKDLGIHTEMFSDGVMKLFDMNVINNEKKSIHRYKIVTSFLMGSRELYDYVDNNPMIECHPSNYTNDPFIISQNDKMISINSAIQVDLMGQICADTIGYTQYSGIGGQVDFIRGAARSKGGFPIIALPSTAAHDTLSRIVPQLDEGAAVTTSRGDAHWIITEYGKVNLHGKNIRQRAEALIGIAHPNFRDELIRIAKERKILP